MQQDLDPVSGQTDLAKRLARKRISSTSNPGDKRGFVPSTTDGADFSPQPSILHLLEAPNDKGYVAWQELGDTKCPPGVLVWHQS